MSKEYNFLKENISTGNLFARDELGHDLVMIAALLGQVSDLEFLLEKGLNPSTPSFYGSTPWIMTNDCSSHPDPKILNILLNYGCMEPYRFLNPRKFFYYDYGVKYFMMETKGRENIKEVLKISNKKLLREVEKKAIFEDSIHTGLFNSIHLIKRLRPNIDEQLLLPLTEATKRIVLYIPDNYLVNILPLLDSFTDKRLIRFISNMEEELDVRSHDRIKSISEMIAFLKFKKEPIGDISYFKDSEQLYKHLNTICQRLSQPNRIFEYPEYVLNLDGLSPAEGISLYIPKKGHELVDLGAALSICVGNGIYSEKTSHNQSYILILKDTGSGKPVGCIEFRYDSIIEAKGYDNSLLDKKLVNSVKKLLESNLKSFES